MTKHSYFKDMFTIHGVVTLKEIIDIVSSDNLAIEVNEIREFISKGDMERVSTLKKKLPCFTPSGIFSDGRSMDRLIKYTNVVHLDFDKVSQKDIKRIRPLLMQNEYVYASFISPSGGGFKVFVMVETGRDQHTFIYNIVKKYFEELLDVKADAQCSDIPRLCFLSYDPEAIYNENSATFKHQPSQSIQECVSSINKIMSYASGSRNNYLFNLARLCWSRGVSFNECLTFCNQKYDDLSSDEIYTTVRSGFSGRYPIKVKATDRKKHGRSKYRDIEEYLTSKYEFRYNEVTGRVEFAILETDDFKEVGDIEFNNFRRLLDDNGYSCSSESLGTILKSDFSDRYDPFKTYLMKLDQWDGYDYIGDLVNELPASDPEYFSFCLRKWLIGVVGSMLKDDIVNQHVLVLVGDQGIGKTTWLNKLVPTELKKYRYMGVVNTLDKDSLVQLSECLLINMDELEAISGKQMDYLKEMITKSYIRVRRPYEKFHENLVRRASFVASVNSLGFLNDSTGSRRFLIHSIQGPIELNSEVRMSDVFSQALHHFLEGERYWLDHDEVKYVNELNEYYSYQCPEEELLLQYFESSGPTGTFMTPTEMISYLMKDHDIRLKLNPNVMGRYLRKHGYIKTKVKNRYGYWVTKLPLSKK